MTTDRLPLLIDRFVRAAEQHNIAIEAMDAAAANRQAAILSGLFTSIRATGISGETAFQQLLEHTSPPVAGMAAVYLLSRRPELALPVLERLALSPGMLGFRAKAALDRWRQGEWDLPGTA